MARPKSTTTTKAEPFVLRFTNKKTYPGLKREAKGKPGRWSVNTLINSILEEHQKNSKNN
jgi:hypothetical protein